MIPSLNNPIDQSCTPPGVIGSSSSDGFSVISSSGERKQRPLSGYNIFFILHRKRIVDGELQDDDRVITIEEVKECMENQMIVRNLSQPKRLHRKTHGVGK